MKKTCGALVIILLITTNAFATEQPLTIYYGKNTSDKANLLVKDAEQDARIKEYYLNQQRNSFNR